MASLLSRLGALLLVLALVFAVSRGILRLLPGDPIETLVAETGLTVPRERLARELGLDRPFLASLAQDAGRAIQGDFGNSLISRQAIGPLLRARFFATLKLTLVSVLLGSSLAIALGMLAAPGASGGSLCRIADRICSAYGALAAALPVPWVGPILILAFAVQLQWLPVGGHILLPAVTLAIPFSGLWARLIRERVREHLAFGAATGARARGIAEWRVLLRYGLAPAAGPLAAYFGTQLGTFLSSGFVAEVIFGYPGMGSLLIDAVLARDYPVVEATIFVGASSALAFTWLGDLAHSGLDPRVRGLS